MRVSARAGGGEQTERDSSRLRSLTEHVRVHPLLHPPSLQNKGFSAVTMCAGGLPAPPPHPLFCLVSTLRLPLGSSPPLQQQLARSHGIATSPRLLCLTSLLLLHDIPRAQMRTDWKGDSAEWLRDTAGPGSPRTVTVEKNIGAEVRRCCIRIQFPFEHSN